MPRRWAARLARRHPPGPKRPRCIRALRRLCPFDSGDRQCRNLILSAFCFTTATRPKFGFMPPSAPAAALSCGTGRGAPRRSNGRLGPAGGYARPARSRSPCNAAGMRVIAARGAGSGRGGRDGACRLTLDELSLERDATPKSESPRMTPTRSSNRIPQMDVAVMARI
jgi:hypothetical protein